MLNHMKRLLLIWTLTLTCSGFGQSFDHSLLNDFLNKYVSETGLVDYQSISPKELNPVLNQFVKVAPDSTWSTNEKLSYWINAYNIFTIKLIVDHYPIKSIKDINEPWDTRFIPIDGKLYSLNEIEHDIIRSMNEPRIHFALVCAAASCPRLYNKSFTNENLDDVLTMLTKEFLADRNRRLAGCYAVRTG